MVAVLTNKRPTRFTLSNGDELIFRQMDVGTNSTFYAGNLFQRVARYLPVRLGGATAAASFATGNDNATNLYVWFTFRGRGDPTSRVQFRLTDDYGFRSACMLRHGSFGGAALSEKHFYLHGDAFPRRSNMIRMLVSEHCGDGRERSLGELSFRNPFHFAYATWPSQQLPLTQRIDTASFTLDAFTLTLDGVSRSIPSQKLVNHADFDLNVRQFVERSDDWNCLGFRFYDATGVSFDRMRILPGVNRSTRVSWSRMEFPIWPKENAIKMESLWINNTPLSPDRVVKLSGVPITFSQKGFFRQVLASTNHPLGKLSLEMRQVYITHRDGSWFSLSVEGDQKAYYDYSTTNVDCYRLHEARNEEGRLLERAGSSDDFYMPSTTRSVDVVIHLPIARRLDFVFSPTLKTNRSENR